ncbi:hypothetical protein [Parerythrobacter aestuarii]|uniref:hypothetical protein n=1 Tax=Parerythrobacter aestuarii TaxID=3020909 RepID=UPI0024DE09BE|nr:hypothetical protein [Parerythrobacter aestuarii]
MEFSRACNGLALLGIVPLCVATAGFAATTPELPVDGAATEESYPDKAMAAPVGADAELAPDAEDATADDGMAVSEQDKPALAEQWADLPMFTLVNVTLNEAISSQTHVVGDEFSVTVMEDVVHNDTIVIPKGSIGAGQVTFATKKGGFGKQGILGLSLRTIEIGGDSFLLDGRYREEGKGNDGAAAATMFMVGIFAGLVKGKGVEIEQGRELRAKTGEDIPYIVGVDAKAVPVPEETGETTTQDAEPATSTDAVSQEPAPSDSVAVPGNDSDPDVTPSEASGDAPNGEGVDMQSNSYTSQGDQ